LLQNAAFQDGGTATGTISLNAYGYIQDAQVVTTAAPPSPHIAEQYVYPGSYSADYLNDGTNNWLVMFSGNHLDIALWLEVASSPALQLAGTDLILGGCETLSFATFCSDHTQGVTRFLDTSQDPHLAVPEPASIAIIGFGAAALFGVVRRRQASAA
jgi:hypothetical protein